MLVHAGAAVDAATRIGHYTPLHVASTVGQTAVIERLIKAGADVTAATSTSGVTPLHLAAASGSPAAVAALLDHGADVDAREGAWGQTPLIFAAARDRVDVVRTLLERGADPAVTSNTVNLVADGRLAGEARRRQRSVLAAFESGDATATPSQVQAAVLAARDHYLSSEAPEVEANNGRPPAIETKGGLTALLHAARQGHIGAATALLDGGADIDQVGAGDGTSPLLMATINAQFGPGPGAHRARRRSQSRGQPQRRDSVVGGGQRRVAAENQVSATSAARIPARDLPLTSWWRSSMRGPTRTPV